MHARQSHTSILPVLSLLLSATLWGIYWYPLRWLVAQGLSGPWIVLLVYSGTMIYVPILMLRHWRECTHSPTALLGIAMASGWCNTAFILGILEGEVVRVVLLFFLSPIWATLLARVFLNERFSWFGYAMLALSLIGAGMVLWKPGVGLPLPHTRADWYGLTSGMAFALSNVLIRKTHALCIQVKTVAAWFGAMAVAGVLLLLDAAPISLPSLQAIYKALLVGAIGMGIMTLSVTYGISRLPIHRSAVIMLFEIVVASVSAYLLAGEIFRPIELMGGLCIVIAAYLTIMYSSSQHEHMESSA